MVNAPPEFDFTELVAQAHEQLADIAAVQRRQAALSATATVADGMVQVSVNARGIVIDTRIDHDYLDEYDVEDLGRHITDAARQAAATVQRRASALMEPLMRHRADLPPLSQIISGAADLLDFQADPPRESSAPTNSADPSSHDHDPTLPDDGDENPWPGVRVNAP